MARRDKYEYHRWSNEPLNLAWSEHRRRVIKADGREPEPWATGAIIGAILGIAALLLFLA